MKLEHYKHLLGCVDAIAAQDTERARLKGECLIWLAEQIEIENEKLKQSEDTSNGNEI